MATRQNVAERATTTVAASQATSTPAASPAAAVREAESSASEPAPPAAPAEAAARPAERPRTTAAPSKPAARPPAPAARPAAAARAEQTPSTPNRPSPSSAPAEPAASLAEVLPSTPAEEQVVEPARAPEPPEPSFDELTVAADSVIGLQTESTLSSENARVEDRVEARVVRDVRAGGRVAIPAGTRALGSVIVVERGGKLRERARLGIRFHTLALADGTRLPITTETIYRYGDAPGNGSAAKIGGGAVAGAILGAIIGGGKGAAIGATTGAAGGGAAVMAGDRSEAVFPAGAQVTARILSPVTVTVDR